MKFWREKKNRIYIFISLIPIILAAQYFLFKYGAISPLVKGVELNIVEGSYIQNIDEYVIKLGETIKVDSGNYIIIPPYAKEPDMDYKASEENILSINGDKITAIGEGYSALMITKNNRAIKKLTIRVVDPKVESLNVNMSNPIKYVGDSSDIEVDVSVNFDFNEEQEYTYEITNDDVITLEDGKIKAIGVGSSDLIIKSGDQKKICKFNNIQAKVSSIKIDSNVNIEENESKKLDVNVVTSPRNLKHPPIKYEYIGLKLPIAKVVDISKDGTITGIREGQGKIKITCGNKSKEITINVTKESIKNKEIQNLDVESRIIDGKLEIIASWDYLDGVSDYEICLRNNSLGENSFNLYKEIKVDKKNKTNKRIQETITIDLKDIQDPSIDLYVVGKTSEGYTKKSKIVEVRHSYKNPNNIENTKVENLVWSMNEDNSITISWDKIQNIDCTYSVYIKNNLISIDGGYELYQHGITENTFTIPSLGEFIDIDVYVKANNTQGSSGESNIINIKNSNNDEIDR